MIRPRGSNNRSWTEAGSKRLAQRRLPLNRRLCRIAYSRRFTEATTEVGRQDIKSTDDVFCLLLCRMLEYLARHAGRWMNGVDM
ncbi:hypothetical protein E4T56_gene19026 [Termitomyces sp. T112]|nr:hypothetical protein E4T56_gene19026 [Termitomyces sp. T112]